MEKHKILAVGQFHAETCRVEKNLSKMQQLAKQASNQGALLLVLPELCATGYRADEAFLRLAQPLDGMLVSALTQMSKDNHGIWIYTAIPEKAESAAKPYNTAVLVNENGLVAAYRKIHLWGKEPNFFSAGNQLVTAATPFGKTGLHVCFDVSFPESARSSALSGAELLLYTFAFANPERRYAFDLLTRTRALENGCFVAAANLTGCEKDTKFFGGSKIIDPAGNVLAELNEEEGIITALMDEKLLKATRAAYPYLERRRPDVYLF